MAKEFARPAFTGGETLREAVDRVQTGGEKFFPQRIDEARATLRPQVRELRESAGQIPQEWRGRKLFFQATLLPNFLAGSHFPERLLLRTGIVAVGSRTARGVLRTARREREGEPTKALILAGEDAAIAALEELLRENHTNEPAIVIQQLTEFSEIRLPTRTEVIRGLPENAGTGEVITWEAVLQRSAGRNNREMREFESEIYEKFIARVEELGGEVVTEYRRVVEDVPFVPIRLPQEALDELAQFNPLRAIRPMPKLRSIAVGPLRAVVAAPQVAPPRDPEPLTHQRFAVFDGGIDPTCRILNTAAVRVFNETPEAPDAWAVNHGSIITSAVLYGYVDPARPLPRPDVAVDHYRIIPVPAAERNDLELNWILDRIIAAVRNNNYPVVNLSLGPELCIDDDDEPHRWTAELDVLAREKDVLFINAAGNNGQSQSDRIQVPADMVNGLSVGACNSRSDQRRWDRSPFSALGPGRWGARVRPTGVAFGGDGAAAGFHGVGPHGRVLSDSGTSYAAPLVTHSIGTLYPVLGARGASPALLRALTTHFAERRSRHHRIEEHGYGRFAERLEDKLECGPNQITVMYEDEIGREETIALTIPFPDGIRANHRVKIQITLCFTAPTDPGDAADYTSAGMELTFRPHANIYAFTDPNTSQRVALLNLVDQRDEVVDAMAQGAVPTLNPHPFSGTITRRSEQGLRRQGKWETTVQMRLSRSASQLYRPRIDLRYYARSGGVLLRENVDNLSYAMVVTAETQGRSDLYDRVRTQFATLVPIAQQIQARV